MCYVSLRSFRNLEVEMILMRLLDALCGLQCPHFHTSRAFRNQATGRDYIVCLTCGKTFDSPIQFGKEKHEASITRNG